MFVPLLVLRNAFRHKLRTALTILGIVVAITAFGLLRTIVDAWYAGANASSSARLVTRSSVSLVFPLPLNYAQKIRQVPGVRAVSWANWFGGIYISERNFFPQFAIDAASYLDMYPEFILSPAERKAFVADRKGAIVGRKLAEQYGFAVGDQIPLRGTIYGGTWTFNLRGIYDGADAGTDTSTMYFHFDLLNETIRKLYPRRGDQAGVFIVQLADPGEAAEVSAAIDATFRNSLAETLTETEKAFQLSFVAMTEAILVGDPGGVVRRHRDHHGGDGEHDGDDGARARRRVRDAEGARLFERLRRAADLRGIDRDRTHRWIRRHRRDVPASPHAFAERMGTLFPIFFVSEETVLMQVVAAIVVGVVAAALPAWRTARMKVVDGLRAVA